MNVDNNDIHNIKDNYRLSNPFLCNFLNYINVDYCYMKCKLEFNDAELGFSSDHKIEIIRLVTWAVSIATKYLMMYVLKIYEMMSINCVFINRKWVSIQTTLWENHTIFVELRSQLLSWLSDKITRHLIFCLDTIRI